MESASKPEVGEEGSLRSLSKSERLSLSPGSRSSDSESIPRARQASQPSVGARLGKGGDGVSRLRGAARKVRGMQAAAKTFSNSQQVRDAVYEEWTARKSRALKTTQRELHEQRMKREAELKSKAAVRAERAEKTLNEWNRQKSLELSERQRRLRQEVEEKRLEDESERERKKAESAAVYTQWKKRKREQLVRQHRAKKREEERAREERQNEDRERVVTSKKVLEIWCQHKDRVLRENVKKAREERRKKRELEMAEKRERAVEADTALKKWEESKKNSRGRETPATPRPAWCPARTLHSVPSSRLSRIQSSKKLSLVSVTGGGCTAKCDESYSQDSFLSVEDTVSFCSEGGSREAGWSEGGDSQSVLESEAGADRTGPMKTVRVCCRTIKYICICDNK